MAFKMKAGSSGPMKKNFPGAFKQAGESGEYIDDTGSPVSIDPATAADPKKRSNLRNKIDEGRSRRKARKAENLRAKADNLRNKAEDNPRSRKRADRLERRATNKEKRATLKDNQSANITEGKDKMANVTDDRTTMQALRGGQNVTFGEEGRKGDKIKTDAVIGDVAPENKEPTVEKTKEHGSFGEAYKAARAKNKAAGVAHYGDKAGFFTYKGKKYNTESREEKAVRLKK